MLANDILEAAEDGNITALESFGESVNQGVVDELGCNCLHYAARQGGANALKFLIQKRRFNAGARSNIGATPLHDAAAAGNLEVVKWLLENTSSDVNDQDGTGATILHLACRFHHTHITGWLLDVAHPDVNVRTASGGIPLHFAVVGGDYEATKLLLEEDPMSANTQTDNGATATYLAAQDGQEEILRLVIQDYRGNVKMKAYDGMSSLHAAAQSGHLNCVKFLVNEEKCNANERDFDGATPLHYSASQGHYKVVDWLMKVGGARVTLDNIGGSPLHNAAETNQIECIKVLIDNGCSTDITDNNGLTASELARKCFNDKSAHFIETYKPHPQQPPDPDIEYLAAVQSPRQPITVTRINNHNTPYLPTSLKVNRLSPSYSKDYHGNGKVAPVVTDQSDIKFQLGSPNSEPEIDYPNVRSVSPLFEAGRLNAENQWHSAETGESESNIARIDSEECLVGIPRKFSEPFLDIEPDNKPIKSSSSSSSLSSLSHLDEVVAVAVKEYEKETLQKKRLETIKQGTNLQVAQTAGTGSNINQSKSVNQRFVSVGGSRPISPPSEVKSVRFQNGHCSNPAWAHRQRIMESEQNTLQNGNTNVDEVDMRNKTPEIISNEQQNGIGATNGESILTNGNGHLSDSDTSESSEAGKGLVIISQTSPELIYPQSMHNPTAPHVSAFNNVASINGEPNTSVPQVLVNGSTSQTVPTPNPPTMSITNPLQEPSRTTIIPIVTKTSISTQTVDKGIGPYYTNDSVPSAPPPPPVVSPPPAPPPPPPLPPTQLCNGDGNSAARPDQLSIAGKSAQEIKNKSASLPARPVGAFTTDMIRSKRNTLTPAPARTSIERTSGMDFDFVAELKKATKDTSTLKATKSSDSPKPVMVFSAGKKAANGTSNKEEKKEEKVELTGEWDPKNFVDMVANKDSLPGWKVQLQARQLAEKTMKETLEKRQVEEREERFKNMPAWKRALVEKKENEAKAAEEKRLQEQLQQEQRKVNRRVPNVSVSPKPVGATGTGLAPWQMELQKK